MGMMALAMLQGGDETRLLTIFVGITAAAFVVQALVFVGMAVGAARSHKQVQALLEQVKSAAIPVLNRSQVILEDLSPKIQEISANVAVLSAMAREKAAAFEPTVDAIHETVGETNRRSRAQIARVDSMVTTTLNVTAELGAMVHEGIRVPLREIVGVVTGFKVALDTLVGTTSFLRPKRKDTL